MLQYLVNLHIGKSIFEGGLQKVENEGQMGEDFESEFNVNSSQMKIAGYFEAVGSAFLLLSFLGRSFTRIGSLMISIVMGTAVFKHLKAGHGYEGSKGALQLLGLSTISFFETFKRK